MMSPHRSSPCCATSCRWTMFDGKTDRLQAVTADDLMRIAQKYLTVDRFRIVVDGPIDQATLDAIKD